MITTTEPFSQLFDVSQKFLQDAQKTGDFIFLQSDLRIDLPQTTVVIDRNLAAQVGLNMQEIGSALSAMLGGGYVNYFEFSGRSYKVIPQVEQKFRLNADQLKQYYLKTSNGQMVPLSTVAHLETKTQPETINHFQQQNMATIQGVAFPGISQGQALEKLKVLAQDTLPQGYSFDYAGASRQFIQESGGLVLTFFFAIVIIFLALAAQFESFRDPVIILVSVPMSIAGALIFINLGIGHATLNIYTEVGLVTLIGLVSKHGILIVEFANNLQRAGCQQARRHHQGRRPASAPDPDDYRVDGAGRGAADYCQRRRCGEPLQHGAGDFQRAVDRHAVYPVRGAGHVHAAGGGSQP